MARLTALVHSYRFDSDLLRGAVVGGCALALILARTTFIL